MMGATEMVSSDLNKPKRICPYCKTAQVYKYGIKRCPNCFKKYPKFSISSNEGFINRIY